MEQLDVTTTALASRWLDEVLADPDIDTSSIYGDSFADVYDEWYPSADDTLAAVEFLTSLALDLPTPGTRGVLELGAGTGRLALPLAAALGTGRVTALDASSAMLDRLRAKPGSEAVTIVLGDMAGPLPDGPFSVVVVATNTLFNLAELGAQERCVTEVARVLAPDGRLVVEAFVPDETAAGGDRVTTRALTAGRDVLTVSRTDLAAQLVVGCHVELVDGAPVRRRPWKLRWKTPEQLDGLCARAGLVRELRVRDWSRRVFDSESTEQVSVYRRATA